MTRAEREGLSRIEGRAKYVAPKSARCIVRIYYISEGGELLCCDSAPLTWVRADELKLALDPIKSDAVDVDVIPTYELPSPPARKARLVVLPSQVV